MSEFLNGYDIVIFDCDGVIFDVNKLKIKAFGEAVHEYPELIRNGFLEYCQSNFGVSRYVKFEKFFEKFLMQPLDKNKYDEMVSGYAKICRQIYNHAELTQGCLDVLKELSSSNKKMFVVSGSDQEELREAFENRKIESFFNLIYGSPRNKVECTQEILSNCAEKKSVFIGDSIADFKTANYFNMDFIYIYDYTVQPLDQQIQCSDGAVKVIKNFTELF